MPHDRHLLVVSVAEAGVPLTASLLPRLAERTVGRSRELTRFMRKFGFHDDAQEDSISDLLDFVNSSIRENQRVKPILT